jgi:hypothetical protein
MLHSADAGVRYLLRPGGACPAGFVFGVIGVAGAGAPLGGSNEAADSCSAPVEFDEAVVLRACVADGCAGVRARAVVPRIAPGSEGGSAGGSISVVVLGEGGVAVLGTDPGVVVPDDCRSSVPVRWPVLAPGQLGNTPAKTRTATAAAATTAAPITRVAAT